MDEQTMRAWAATFVAMMIELGKGGRELAEQIGLVTDGFDARDLAFFDEAVAQIVDLGVDG